MGGADEASTARAFLAFLNESWTPFHAVEASRRMLEAVSSVCACVTYAYPRLLEALLDDMSIQIIGCCAIHKLVCFLLVTDKKVCFPQGACPTTETLDDSTISVSRPVSR